MATYQIYLQAVASASVEVEAESEEEALELVWDCDLPYSCHQCPELGDWEFPPDTDPYLKQEHYITKISD